MLCEYGHSITNNTVCQCLGKILYKTLMCSILPEFTDVVLDKVARLVVPLVAVSRMTPQHDTVLLSNTSNGFVLITSTSMLTFNTDLFRIE